MAFRFFAHGEDLKLLVFASGGHTDCERNGVGSQSHAANRLSINTTLGEFFFNRLPAKLPDEISTHGVHRGDAAVDVEVGCFSGREGELAGADGFLKQKFFQLGTCVVGHGFLLSFKTEVSNSKNER